MPAPRNRPLTIALYLNAGLLAAIVVILLGRSRSPFDSVAFGQQAPQAIAGGAGFYLMPAQFSGNSWGCYVMDVDAQTLIAYVYNPAGSGTLRLAASRNFSFDRQLRSYNTQPRPEDIDAVVKLERDTARRPEDATTRPTVPNE